MSSIRGQNRYDASRHLNYISTAPFGDNIFTYTVTRVGLNTVGSLQSLLSVGSSSSAGYNTLGGTFPTAPAGRILRVNNRKIFPGANPCTSITTSVNAVSGTSSTATVTQLNSQMVGVIDVLTGLHGFIDPNDTMFTIYNVDKAIDYPNDGGTPSGIPHSGPSVYTSGTVSAVSGLTTTAGNVTALGSYTPLPTMTVALTSITANGAAASQTLAAVESSETVTITCAPPGGAASITLNGTYNNANNATVSLVVTATTAQTTTITFGTAFSSSGTLVVTAAAGPATRYYIVNFLGNGTNLVEISRSGPLTVSPVGNIAGNALMNGSLLVSNNLTVGESALLPPVSSALTIGAVTGAQAAQSITAVTSSATVTFSSAATGAASITINGATPNTNGALLSFVATAATAQTTTITFGTGFSSSGTLAIAAAAGPATRYYIVNFVGDGTNLVEVSRSGALTAAPTSTTLSDGKIFLANSYGPSAVCGTLTLTGATAVTVTTSACTINSLIFLSRRTLGGTMAHFSITTQSAGSFIVTGIAGDTSTVNWLIIN